MSRALLVILAVFIVFTQAHAGFVSILEEEPNDSLLTAQSIPQFAPNPFGTGQVQGTLTPGDVDFFAVQFDTPVIFTALLIDLTEAQIPGVDAYLGVYNQQGELVHFNDDVIPSSGLLAGLEFDLLPAGLFYFAVTGEPDLGFQGLHDQELSYRLSITYTSIPAPASLGLVSAMLLPSQRRRR